MCAHIPRWRNGDILKAQHFQSLHNSIENAFSFSVKKHEYGVVEMKIDHAKFDHRMFALDSITAVIQDGTLISQECNLSTEIKEDATIYLGIAKQSSAYNMRYTEYTAEIKDWQDNSNAQIDCIKHKLRLFSEEEQGYTCLPIAQIKDGMPDPEYSPPVLCVKKHSILYNMLSVFISYLRDKIESLKTENMAFSGVIESAYELDALLRLESFHPKYIYLSLVKLLARSALLKKTKVIPIIPGYNHNNIYLSYSRLIDGIKNNMSVIYDLQSILLEQQKGIFWTDIVPVHQYQKDQIVFGIEFNHMTRAQLVKWIETAVIEGEEKNASLNRVRGAKRKIVNAIDKLGLEERSNFILVSISIDNEYINKKDKIFFSNPSFGAQSPDSIKLFRRL